MVLQKDFFGAIIEVYREHRHSYPNAVHWQRSFHRMACENLRCEIMRKVYLMMSVFEAALTQILSAADTGSANSIVLKMLTIKEREYET